ncbi:MAG: RNA-binding S4 domain-containing protein [Lachnospiraceae bacterium]|nr:RNA-binding S4 domain-containing protein [Lachnospiraceae bacterium]
METLKIKDEFIKLGQALKLAGVVMSGVDAKFVIQDGLVKVNGAPELQRGKKLYDGDKFEYDGKEFVIKAVN